MKCSYSTIATIVVISSQLYLFQNCHNCKNCAQKRIHIFFFKIDIIATIVVIRSFQNCHNCDNCCHRDSYLFFPQLPQLQQLLSSGVNCIFIRIVIIATIVTKRDLYILFFFKIAIIATIDVTRIFQNYFR